VPQQAPPGSYKLQVATKSTLGEEKLEQDVKIKAAPRVLLVTDKPLYQPGQRMHIRALALQEFNLHPVDGPNLTFEVEDAKGNKVFKQSHKTSAYGIASVDFQLADEVNTGDYHVRALLGERTAEKTVTVKPYVLPKFKIKLEADKRYYLPKETIQADLQVDYFFGKPAAGGKVKVTASTFDVAFKDFQTWEGKTDAQGHVKFDIKLPDYFVGQPLNKGNALVKLEAQVTDTADHSETVTRTYPVSAQPIQVSLIAEGGRLIPDMENRIFAAAVYPDGSPAAKCTVKVWQGQAAKGKPLAEIKTNEAGLTEFLVTPKAGQFRQGPWTQRHIEMLGGRQTQVWGPQQLFDLTAEVRDAKGETAVIALALNSEPFGENVLLRLDKAIYKGGEPLHIDIRSSAGMPNVYLDVVKLGQTLLTKWLDVKEGKAEHKLDLPASVGAEAVDRVHPRARQGGGELLHRGPGRQRPGFLGRQGRQHARSADQAPQEARRQEDGRARVAGDQLPGRRPVARLRPRRQPDGRDDCPNRAGHAHKRPIHQQRQQGAGVPDQVERAVRHLGQHLRDNPVAQGAGRGGRGRHAQGRHAVHHPRGRQGGQARRSHRRERRRAANVRFERASATRCQRGDIDGEGRD
jgi:5-hydroxyisourate hydrolase-like protein (transthyretin family)